MIPTGHPNRTSEPMPAPLTGGGEATVPGNPGLVHDCVPRTSRALAVRVAQAYRRVHERQRAAP